MPTIAGSRQKRGVTVLELLVAMAIAVMVAAIVLPALGAARESARRIACVNNQRQLGLAAHAHHDSLGRLPIGWQFDPSGQSAYGWAVSLLPFTGQVALHDNIDIRCPIGDPRHSAAQEATWELMLCPSDIAEPNFLLYEDHEDDDVATSSWGTLGAKRAPVPLLRLPTSNYVGMFGTFEMDDEIPAPIGDGAFLENRTVCFGQFGRGLSQTLLIGERTMAQAPSTWYGVDLSGEDASARMVGAALEGVNKPYADECDFSSRHPGGANFLYADGHVGFVEEDIDLRLYHELARLLLSERDH
ncbi:MAG: DUF1559 domain-containing protein [Planctomycetales bacterium]|nr:DUF1559 domain-containing protein [Planctomycetales bacterium]